MITGQLKKGQNYNKIKQVVNIVITGHKVFKDDPAYHHCFTLHDTKNQLEYPERLVEMHFLEIPKLPSVPEPTPLWDWLRFFGAKTKGELKLPAKRVPEIAEAIEVLVDLSADNLTRELAESR